MYKQEMTLLRDFSFYFNKNIWDKVFKNAPSKICGRQPLKNLKHTISLKFFKDCLPQISHGPILNTLSHLPVKYFSHLHKFYLCISVAGPILYLGLVFCLNS